MQFQEEQDYTKKLDAGLWKRLLHYAKPFHKKLWIISIAMLLCAAGDVIFPLLTREAIDTFVATGTTQGLTWFVIKYVAVVLAQVACIFTFCYLSGRVEVGVCHLIRDIGFKRLQELPFSFYDKTPVGYMIARMTSDTQRLGDTIGWGLIDLMWSLGYVVMSAAVMIRLNAKIALTVLLVMPVIAVVAAFFQKRILASYRVVRKTNSKITGAFNEGIMGAKTTKTLVREEKNFEEFQELTGVMRKSSIHAAIMSALFMPIVMSLGALATAYALWKGGYEVFEGLISIGTLTAFMSYTTQMFEPISNMARIFADLQSSQAAAERVITLIETEPEIADSPEVKAVYGDSFHPKKENWPEIQGDVEFRNVTFRYTGGERVLENFSLKVRHGETIALVGETGSGKSTIVNLICRFYEPTEGEILIDGVDYRQRSQLWLQSHLGYVLQQPHLFSGTIRENIRYGRLDATDEEVAQAARMVDAEEFILRFEKGYDTDVGEGGNRLSIGQKQLISFARALLANPAIFVLDEATSSVDTEAERKIQHAIQTALHGRTSFIIAHRLSTVRSADRILVIQHGEITEEGNHSQLLKKKGYYYNLYTNQFKEERESAVLGKAAQLEG
ncbi:MAG: ABC transporter ATP-binding protein [Eubacteriales bacterium]|nr:ABC transporter ATP-binding protein [Eubacteriales bacterium]